jgi:hypothetical protein
MADWATISSLATAAGTMVLAFATYAAVRSSNRSAQVAELALRQQLRPVLVNSRFDDPEQKIMFMEGRWIKAGGSRAAVEHQDGVVYLGLSIRNVGTGIAVLVGWHVWPPDDWPSRAEPVPLEEFRRQLRDLLIPAGDIGLWQGAVRDSSEDLHGVLVRTASDRRPFAIDLLYADHVGSQRAITRFSISPSGDDLWLTGAVRHWLIEGDTPHRDTADL